MKAPARVVPTYDHGRPSCGPCFRVFSDAFGRVNEARERLDLEPFSAAEIVRRASVRALMLRHRGEWVCVRCAVLPAHELKLVQGRVYPHADPVAR